jgi:hypothetical protein
LFNGSAGQRLSNTNITSLSFIANSPSALLPSTRLTWMLHRRNFTIAQSRHSLRDRALASLRYTGIFVCAMVATALRFSLPMETSLRAISATLLPQSPDRSLAQASLV